MEMPGKEMPMEHQDPKEKALEEIIEIISRLDPEARAPEAPEAEMADEALEMPAEGMDEEEKKKLSPFAKKV